MAGEPDPVQALRESSRALQAVLAEVLRAERRSQGMSSPVELMQAILHDEAWAWLRPLYALIADIDHALSDRNVPVGSEAAAIGEHARSLLAGNGTAEEGVFFGRYRMWLQGDAGVAMAHGAAIQALRRLPAGFETESERLHARHQWNERRRHQREGR